MIKQYKHKVTGDIAELKNQAGYSLNKSTIGLIPIEYIENSSDWEKVKQEEYEIIAFSFRNEVIWEKEINGKFYPRNHNSFFSKFKGTSESWFLSFLDSSWQIYSVKRL